MVLNIKSLKAVYKVSDFKILGGYRMSIEVNEKCGSVLMNSSISKKEAVEQVWKIYNETIPMTEKQSEMKGKRSKYEADTRVRMEFGEADGEYLTIMESERKAKSRYDQFKELVKKDIDKILENVCSPLKCYQNSKKIVQIPVVVAATFAAICDMRKYYDLQPHEMFGTGVEEIEETVNMLIAPSVAYVLKYYDEDEYFLSKLIENLKYFFNIEPKPEETSLGIIRSFNYQIIEDNGKFIITTDERIKSGKIVKIDKVQIAKEIEEFRQCYVANIIRQAEIKEKAANIIENVNNILKNYTGKAVEAVREKIIWSVYKNYCLNNEDPYELERVVPLDFTEPQFNDCHYMLNQEMKRQFYTERNKKISNLGKKNRAYFEKNDLFDEVGLKQREVWLAATIKEELKNINEKLYNGCQQQIEAFNIRAD